jgi:hypothetical protein
VSFTLSDVRPGGKGREMKRKLITALMLAVAIGVFGSVNGALALTVVWQIGDLDGVVDPIDGASEYAATGAFDLTFNYVVGSDSDPINNPSMPGYLGPQNVAAIASDGRPATDTTALLNILFTLDGDISDSTLTYGRYGSESDRLYLDGVLFATLPVGTEGGFQEYSFDLGSLAAGDYVISIDYDGGGAYNGHYIDYLQLTHAPEPATMLLFGTGLVCLVGLRKKFKK